MYRAQTHEPHQISLDVRKAFDIQKVLSESAYRVVSSAVHRSSGENVVIKVLKPFDHSTLCMRSLGEMKLLRYFNHENIISILDIEKPCDYDSLTEIYLIQEPMDTDLQKVIRTWELSDNHCRCFTWQTLRALDAMHSAGVLHRDLKPSNLLLNDNCNLKVGDLSLARSAASVANEQRSTRDKRISVEDALKHPYFERYHHSAYRATAVSTPNQILDFDEGKSNLSKEHLKRLIYDEIVR